MRTNTTRKATNWSKLQIGKDSCGFSSMCPEQQEQDHDEVRYQLLRLYDHCN